MEDAAEGYRRQNKTVREVKDRIASSLYDEN
jgi:hypothetical protein